MIPAGEFDQSSCAADRAVMAAVVKQLRPVIAGIKDEATRENRYGFSGSLYDGSKRGERHCKDRAGGSEKCRTAGRPETGDGSGSVSVSL